MSADAKSVFCVKCKGIFEANKFSECPRCGGELRARDLKFVPGNNPMEQPLWPLLDKVIEEAPDVLTSADRARFHGQAVLRTIIRRLVLGFAAVLGPIVAANVDGFGTVGWITASLFVSGVPAFLLWPVLTARMDRVLSAQATQLVNERRGAMEAQRRVGAISGEATPAALPTTAIEK